MSFGSGKLKARQQQPLPWSTKESQKYRQSSETSIFELMSVPIAQAGTVSNSTPPPGFPQRHVAMRVTLHSGRNSQLRSPLGTAPHAPQPPNYLAWSPPKIPWPPGHHTTQNNRTHQHFHLHPRASSDTAAAAVRPLTGTDRVLKSTKAL